MKESRDYVDLSLHAVECFLNGGGIDEHEWQALIDIAERDGLIDANEIRVLENLIARGRPDELSPAVRGKLAEIKAKLESAR
ncbi:hypothetical protein EBB59_03375 [Lysobacter pythonis]|uniref:Uncharacterized protein n=1 Tax=Solilutibacter pythonis TaxID=2483112 RepID=A0A3M2I3M6_9GAMM|nr:hypothetical protein [Lysobacter pythonis]RMH94209.1 hypothetical protein EBB59_03375 [Lysobacter pythonis]